MRNGQIPVEIFFACMMYAYVSMLVGAQGALAGVKKVPCVAL